MKILKNAALLALALLFLAGTVFFCLKISTAAVPGPSSSLPEETAALTLSGLVAEGSAMHTLVVKAENGSLYGFSTEGVSLTTGSEGVLIGCPVTVSYRGSLDAGRLMQEVSVLAIQVKNRPAEPASKAQALLSTLSVEEKVGQLFLIRCPKKNAAAALAAYRPAGVLLFSENTANKSASALKAELEGLQQASSVPLLIGVDEEGGTVNRLSRYKAYRAAPFLSPQQLYAAGGLSAVSADTQEKCAFLKALGVNMNMAPVCDVSVDPANFIYQRSFGQGAAATGQYVKCVVQAMKKSGVCCVLKHFPGYGPNGDTHTGAVRDTRPYSAFLQSDFIPFEEGIAAGADCVLVSHNTAVCMDSENPASLSPEVHRILREELGFQGVILTDDLYMDAIRDTRSPEDAAVEAVLAGNDLLCSTEYESQMAAVLKAVQSGVIPESRLDDAVLRVLNLKNALGLLP